MRAKACQYIEAGSLRPPPFVQFLPASWEALMACTARESAVNVPPPAHCTDIE